MRTIHVNSTEQTEILQMTKEKIENQSLESNINKKQNAMTMGLSKEKKKELIRDKTDEILRKVPVEYRDVKREEVMRKVKKKLKTRGKYKERGTHIFK